MDDAAAMRQAVLLGERGRVGAPPNPWVGSVVVAGGAVAGEGFHARPGTPHAEVHALREAGEAARGATLVVTLEPCDHQGRTPPCTEALMEAGVARVVVGALDPDERVRGRGVARLRDAGLDVVVGVEARPVERSLAPYFHHRTTGRAYCLAKTAVSIDGRTAAADGSSQWITGEAARGDAQQLRAQSQAIVVGSGTALADRPALTVRSGEVPPEPPLRVVLDARGRVPADGPLFDVRLGPTLVFTTASADPAAVRAWKEAGAEVEEVAPGAGGGVAPGAVLDALGRREVLQALVEGGASVHGALVRSGLVDRLTVYVGARVLGDGGRPTFASLAVPTIADAGSWRLCGVAHLGDDVRLDYEPAAAGGVAPAAPAAAAAGERG